ncbi:GNAT family N-acetyltransferase [Streptomyces sp. NPDC058671]|uniref:GNAT family N-acetyltransferase n=1 Tax=Streptomyces sp. NPDC058671 TaxID=3346590 RepID=UPI0036587205
MNEREGGPDAAGAPEGRARPEDLAPVGQARSGEPSPVGEARPGDPATVGQACSREPSPVGEAPPGDPATVRHARPGDLARVVELIAEHAAYEKAAPPAPGLADRLARLLFAPAEPRLRCLVAVLPDGTLAGYATCAPELSTWDGTEYLHMDCLYLTESARGHGLGPLLLAAVRTEARALGLAEIQWQTPAWNESAIRFYDRLGAPSKEKRRYTLRVGDQTGGQGLAGPAPRT